MKNKLLTVLTIGLLLATISIILKNIYLLGISELITFPVAAKLFILNLKNQN
jgi:hypothetical protein